jgi:hypothetical protein
MYLPLQIQIDSFKLQRQPPLAARHCHSTSGRLFVVDRKTGQDYLIDTGSDLSVFPKNMLPQKRVKSNYTLHAANGSSIATYGWLTLTLDLGIRKNFSWRFIVDEVTKPIIGVDFLSHFKLLVAFQTSCRQPLLPSSGRYYRAFHVFHTMRKFPSSGFWH